MSNVFVFVCGINPEVYTCISGELQTIVDLDGFTRRCGSDIYIDDDARTIRSYQSMQMQCLQESIRNGNESCPIYLYVRLARYTPVDLSTLKTVIHFNKGHVKSLLVSNPDKITEFMQSLDPGVFTSLETLRVEQCDKEPVWLTDILTESARALKCLTLSGRISLSDISIMALKVLTCLQSLYLDRVNMTHSNLKGLYALISKTTTLTQLRLEYIACSDHMYWYHDCDVTLDTHRLNELKMLHLVRVPCIELHVNPARLEKLEFWPLRVKVTARASATLWQDLHAAPFLSSLALYRMSSCQEMIQTIPTLSQLQYLQLEWIDMDDVIPLSPDMTQLEHVGLQQVTMSSAAWRKLFFSVGQLQHPVTVELSCCKGPSREEWKTIVNVIKTTPTLSLLQDLRILDWSDAFLTLKNKTV